MRNIGGVSDASARLFNRKVRRAARWKEAFTWKLQTVGSERLEFLYANEGRGKSITLKPGVAFCFRAFYSLLQISSKGRGRGSFRD